MKRKDDMIQSMGQAMIIFGVTVVVLMIVVLLVGEDAREYSTIFALGYQGLRIDTLAQFLMMAASITGLRRLLFSDGLISRVSMTLRTFLMFFTVILLVAVYATVFGWFPINDLKAWGSFFACFGLCSIASAYIMARKTERENKEMEEALRKLKEAEKEEEEENKEEK
ncbi:MAG: hypothetical protein J6K04_01255 [Lachnospiraceae bacterium]|nr:hypothetical protein [Lachnospiraceae bacterium]